MEENNELVRVYTGTELTAKLLKEELEKQGIPGMVRNDFKSGVMAGFSGGMPSDTDLYIQESDLEKARPIINRFNEINE